MLVNASEWQYTRLFPAPPYGTSLKKRKMKVVVLHVAGIWRENLKESEYVCVHNERNT